MTADDRAQMNLRISDVRIAAYHVGRAVGLQGSANEYRQKALADAELALVDWIQSHTTSEPKT